MKKIIPLLFFLFTGCASLFLNESDIQVPEVKFTFDDFYYENGIEPDEGLVEGYADSLIREETREVEIALKRELAVFGLVLSEREKRDIAKWVRHYSTKGRGRVIRALKRGKPYLPLIEEKLREYGLPEELKYLPIIESSFKVEARSRRRAIGIWQFMARTARKYGLKVDWWIDERYDPIYSTDAACKYLKALYEMFGKWDFAIAAYNVGEGKILKWKKRKKADNFWDIKRYLPRETRGYVPAYFGLLVFLHENYDILQNIDNDPFEFDSVKVPRQVNVSLLAKWAGISLKEFRKLNPRFRRWATPPYLKNFYVRIPKGRRDAFIAKMNSTPKSKWYRALAHRVRKGETLSHIARRYGVSVRALIIANNIKNPRRLRVGKVLVIPYPGTRAYASVKRASSRKSKKVPPGAQVYIVKRGDTLWDISRKLKVSIYNIKKWNNLISSRIKPGQRLIIYKSTSS